MFSFSMNIFSTEIGLASCCCCWPSIPSGDGSVIEGSLWPVTYPIVFFFPSTKSIIALVIACSPLNAVTRGPSPNAIPL